MARERRKMDEDKYTAAESVEEDVKVHRQNVINNFWLVLRLSSGSEFGVWNFETREDSL
jgi:hypothetical protein